MNLIRDYYFKWCNDGEDRNRYFFWTADPFLSLKVFEYGMNIPNSYKRLGQLNKEFMNILFSQGMSINNNSWGAPFDSWQRYYHLIGRSLFGKLPSKLQIFLRDQMVYRNEKVNTIAKEFLLDSIDKCPTILEYLSFKEIRRILDKGCNVNNFGNLSTVAGYIRLQQEALTKI